MTRDICDILVNYFVKQFTLQILLGEKMWKKIILNRRFLILNIIHWINCIDKLKLKRNF